MDRVYQGLHNLAPVPGTGQKPKRLGRGESSGHGKTCGKGNKGQKARKSGNVRIGFEGGQVPLIRRLPKRGFNNKRFQTPYQIINVEDLSLKFKQGDSITPQELVEKGLVNKPLPIKLLGNGEIDFSINIKVHAASKSAGEKIKAKGGQLELLK